MRMRLMFAVLAISVEAARACGGPEPIALDIWEAARKIPVGTDYSRARDWLLQAGWQKGVNETDPSIRCGERPDVCAAFPEADGCSYNNSWRCVMIFHNGQNDELLITVDARDPKKLTFSGWEAVSRDGSG